MTSPRILCCTPVYGMPSTATVHLEYMKRMIELTHQGPTMLAHRLATNVDLVRARSRAVRIALDHCFTHLLFWDSDVVGDVVQCLGGMIAQNCDVIAAAYPRKRYPIKGSHTPPYVAMGFTLISASCLERMWDAYYDELNFDDYIDGKPVRTVALFQLIMRQHETEPYRVLLSEDYSFCERWMKLGGDIHIFDGPGAPLQHIGQHAFDASREEMGTI